MLQCKLFSICALGLLLLLQAGCATIIKGDSQPLNINSNVEGASVFLNGTRIGVTPLSAQVGRKKSAARLTLKKEGYRDRTVLLDTTVEGVFWVNIISGGALGSTTDYATESMFKYAPSTINVDLVKKK